jgi:selenocysteine lyase/cysteine desulfurase
MTVKNRPRLTVGSAVRVPVLGGERRYVNFDNAASTPPFTRVVREVNRFCRWYSNVHRGTGFKSRYSSESYERAREAVGRFINAAPSDAVLFTRNTTQAINHLANRLSLSSRPVILVSGMEHHSNDLPWRRVGQVMHVRLQQDGRLDENHLNDLLRTHRDRVGLLAVTGASNVTGYINPVHRYARWVHEAGGRIVVDAAQLSAHRPLDMRPADDPAHLDFVAFSAHKMYAPFGVGVLAGPRQIFAQGDPYEVGGGTVTSVSEDQVRWTELPDREEAGTPCVVGAVALEAAIRTYEALGWSGIQRHETALTELALARLARVPGLRLYGDSDPRRATDRLGVIAFNLNELPHGLVAAILSREWGIGTRSGCFCAQIYVRHLLGIDEAAAQAIEQRISQGDRGAIPGAVRVSIGLYNRASEIETLASALEAIAAGEVTGEYVLDRASGEFRDAGSGKRGNRSSGQRRGEVT